METLLKDKTHKAIMRCVLCLFTGKEYKIITGEQEGVIDCSKKIEDPEMPLSSIFVCQGTLQHRAKAIEKLINEY